MSRQSVLIWILVALVMFGLPVHYMDAAMEGHRNALAQEVAKLEPLRKQAQALHEQEAKLAARTAALGAIRNRLIETQPFATMQGELAAAAAKAGVSLSSLVFEGPLPVAELPDVVRYQATLQVAGDANQYLAFLKVLEGHRLLIELPEVSLHLQPPAVRGALPRVQEVLVLGFYAASGKK